MDAAPARVRRGSRVSSCAATRASARRASARARRRRPITHWSRSVRGDESVPYATALRLVRQLTEKLAPEVPSGRVASSQASGPRSSGRLGGHAQNKVRFFEAALALVRAAAERGLELLIIDDLQFADAASASSSGKSPSAVARRPGRLRAALAYRRGDSESELEGLAHDGVQRATRCCSSSEGLAKSRRGSWPRRWTHRCSTPWPICRA